MIYNMIYIYIWYNIYIYIIIIIIIIIVFLCAMPWYVFYTVSILYVMNLPFPVYILPCDCFRAYMAYWANIWKNQSGSWVWRAVC